MNNREDEFRSTDIAGDEREVRRPAARPPQTAAPRPSRPSPRPLPSEETDSDQDDQVEEGGGAGARGRAGRRQFTRRRKVCSFCVDHVEQIDYKRVDVLRRFLTERGKIKGMRKTGTCAKHQRRLAVAIKRARHLALLPFTEEYTA